jgi:hypothetical protein
MKEQDQLPLIREFMSAVAPEVLRFEHEAIRELEDHFDLPERVADLTLEIAIRLAAKYARCYAQFSEKDSAALKESKTRAPIARIRVPR